MVLVRVIKNIVWSKPVRELVDVPRRFISKNFYKFAERNRPGNYYSRAAFDYYKCIFIHIPKCAGVSISRSIFGNLSGGHNRVVNYQKYYSPNTYQSYFKFTIVRNPWSRLFSAYNFLRSGGFSERDKAWFDSNLSQFVNFEDFVLNWLSEKSIYEYLHFWPQVFFLKNLSGEVELDYIGHFETIDHDFKKIVSILGIPELTLPHHNQMADVFIDHRRFFSDVMIRKVADIYEDDINVLKYRFN